ncbi:MAG: NADH-quinone oxidoreductase subunit A [Chloroflexi bacterium]|nr:NADH-quinone oxidoreductase subunit A [Chloroflexota bacterium]
MLGEFGFVGLLFFVAILFPIGAIVTSYLLSKLRMRPDRPNPIKGTTFECGIETVGPAWVQFNFRYYFVALLFVVFDVEVIFLYPWAVAIRQLKLFGFLAVLLFILVLVVGLVYDWKKEGLEWK